MLFNLPTLLKGLLKIHGATLNLALGDGTDEKKPFTILLTATLPKEKATIRCYWQAEVRLSAGGLRVPVNLPDTYADAVVGMLYAAGIHLDAPTKAEEGLRMQME